MKVIHLPSSIGNHGYSMAVAERRAGLDSSSMIIHNNDFKFLTDNDIKIRKGLAKFYDIMKLLKQVNNNYDIFHFNFGQTLLDFPKYKLDLIDLNMYKGSKFMTFNGSDIRMPVNKEDNPYTPFAIGESNNNYILKNKHKRKRINKIVESVDHCFALNPDLMRFLPSDKATFLPYIKYVWYDIEKVKKTSINSKTFKVVHAPSNRIIKGSDDIITTINKLKRKYNIELILVENMSHNEALKTYRNADLIIDQLRIGWYGGFALEAMKMGIPVATYINESDLVYIPSDMRSALSESIVNINKDTIEDALLELIENRNLLNTFSENGYNYVNEFHNPDKLIKGVITKYKESLKI